MATKPQQTSQEPAAEFSLDTAALLARGRARASRSPGGARGTSPGAGCAATTSRSASLVVFVLIVAGVRARAGVREARRAHRSGHEPHHRAGQGRRQGRDRHLGGRDVHRSQDGRAPRPPGDDPRPDLVARRRQVRPRRRRQRPRRRRAAPLRRHQLAQGRHRFGADLRDLRRDPGAARRLLRRLGRLGDHAFLRPDLGVPRDPALDRARLGAGDQRLPPLRRSTLEGDSLWIPTLVISYVLIPYIGRPLRGQILSLREKEFVEAAIAQGARASA